MTAASPSLGTAVWKARFATGLLLPCYTTAGDTTWSMEPTRGLAKHPERHLPGLASRYQRSAAFIFGRLPIRRAEQ
jgi:hypothetical protein